MQADESAICFRGIPRSNAERIEKFIFTNVDFLRVNAPAAKNKRNATSEKLTTPCKAAKRNNAPPNRQMKRVIIRLKTRAVFLAFAGGIRRSRKAIMARCVTLPPSSGRAGIRLQSAKEREVEKAVSV